MKVWVVGAVAMLLSAPTQADVSFDEYEAVISTALIHATRCSRELRRSGPGEMCQAYADYLPRLGEIDSAIMEKYGGNEDELASGVSDARWQQHTYNVEALRKEFMFIGEMLR